MLLNNKIDVEKVTCTSHMGYFYIHKFNSLAEAKVFFGESLAGLYELYEDGSEGMIESDEDAQERFKGETEIVIGKEISN